MFTLQRKKSGWQKASKSMLYGALGVSTFLTAFVLRRMLQVSYYKQFEAHEQMLKNRQTKVLALIFFFALTSIVFFTKTGQEMAASLFTLE